jgi:predicted transcriptional regulator
LVFVCVLAITAVPVVGAVDSAPRLNESDSVESTEPVVNETESVRNVTETTAENTTSRTLGVVENTTSRTLGVVENVTDIADGSEPSSDQNDSGTASTSNETADRPDEDADDTSEASDIEPLLRLVAADLDVSDSEELSLSARTALTNLNVTSSDELSVRTDSTAINVNASDELSVQANSTDDTGPNLTLTVSLPDSDESAADIDVVAVPDSEESAAEEQETDSTPTPTPESTSEDPDTDGTPTPTAGDSDITTPVNASDQQDTGSDDDDDSSPLLGSLVWFDSGFLDMVPPLGTAMFVVLSRPLVGLISALPSLLSEGLSRFAAVFRYGRRDGSDPLEHETRSRIAELVTDSPGISMSELATDLDTPLSTIRHHLKVLERERVLNSQKIRGNRRLFPVGTENEELVAALEKESSAAIIETLQRYGTATVGDIVDEVETSYSTVSYHLSKLADEGIIVQEKDGATKVTQLAPSVQSLLGTTEETPPSKSPSREVGAD